MRQRYWVCDGCMRQVGADEVTIWADFEHVLCKRCAAVDK